MCYHAKAGYEARGKREQIGLLFGRVEHRTVAHVRQAVLYRARQRTRNGINIDHASLARRWQALERSSGEQYLGMFHSHVEVAGEVCIGLSDIDVASFRDDLFSLLELLVTVRAAGRRPPGKSPRVLTGFEEKTGYVYTVRAYGKTGRGIRLLPVRRLPAAV